MNELKQGRVALVTGAASGIGLAIARRLALDGFRLVLADRADAVTELAAEIAESTHRSVEAHICDVSKESDMVELVQFVSDTHARCDVLVNNAGIHPKVNGAKYTIDTTTLDQWNEVLAINLTSVFVLSREILPLMSKNPGGRIVNIASRAGRTASPVASAQYAASKSGVIGFTRVLALELGPLGATANCIAPGPIETPMSSQLAPEAYASATRSIPVGRFGRADEIASAVSFLASEESSFLTGAVLDVNGGTYMP